MFLTHREEQWAKVFETESLHLVEIDRTLAVEHVGSTSIPDLLAKPVVDVMVGSLTGGIDQATNAMNVAGYARAVVQTIPDRVFFRRALGRTRIHGHATDFASGYWRQHIMFREHLRHDEDTRALYERLKVTLLQDGVKSEYTAKKGPFIVAVLRSCDDCNRCQEAYKCHLDKWKVEF